MPAQNPRLLLNEDGSAKDRIVGFETEYGIGCALDLGTTRKDHRQAAWAQSDVLHSILLGASPHFTEFDADGDRRYIDVGPHPEVSTAEETLFLDAAYRLLHGHVKQAEAHRSAVEYYHDHRPDDEPVIKKFTLVANTCVPQGESWGSHQNILAPRALEPNDYIPALAAHHLSRIVWSGAGHVRNDNTGHPWFVLSEKADHIWQVAGPDTVKQRPLINMRDEPLADPEKYRRIHDVSGESVFSPFTNALRLASESIILRACELGVTFDDLLPIIPIKAIRKISDDPSLTATVELHKSRQETGVSLQRAIAERALKAALQAEYLTTQEAEWGARWLSLLDDLERDIEACNTRLDWVVKQNLINRALEENAKQQRPQKPGAVAATRSVSYHRLLPDEGTGMKLLRQGFFADSPSELVLDRGLPLPPNRARLRGRAAAVHRHIMAAERYNLNFDEPLSLNWHTIFSPGTFGSGPQRFSLKEPYNATHPGLEAFLDRLTT